MGIVIQVQINISVTSRFRICSSALSRASFNVVGSVSASLTTGDFCAKRTWWMSVNGCSTGAPYVTEPITHLLAATFPGALGF